MKKVEKFKDLTVWQKGHQLTLGIYKVTKDFPAEEKFGLISQMRRAAFSIPANIAEGFIKRGKKDKINFYNVSQGSLEELKYFLTLSKDLGYIEDTRSLYDLAEEVGRMLYSLVRRIRESS